MRRTRLMRRILLLCSRPRRAPLRSSPASTSFRCRTALETCQTPKLPAQSSTSSLLCGDQGRLSLQKGFRKNGRFPDLSKVDLERLGAELRHLDTEVVDARIYRHVVKYLLGGVVEQPRECDFCAAEDWVFSLSKKVLSRVGAMCSNMLFSCLSRNGKDAEMAALLDRVENAGVADASHYFWVQMRALKLPKDAQRAPIEGALRRLQAQGLRPNASNYLVVLKTLQSCPQDITKMDELMAEMQTQKLPFSRDIYYSCLNLLSQRNECLDVARVEDLARSLRSVDLDRDGKALSFLVRAYTYARLPIKARRLLEEMDFAGISVDVLSVQFFPELIRLLSLKEGNDAKLAKDLLGRFRDTVPARTAPYNSLLTVISKFGHFTKKDAEDLLGDMEKRGVQRTQKTFSCVLAKYAHSKPPDASGAMTILRRMKYFGFQPGVREFNYAMYAFGSLGMTAEGFELLKQMDEDGVKPNAASFMALINACAKARESQIDLALSLVDEMKQRGVKPTTQILNVLLNAFAESERKKTDVLLKHVRDWKVEPDTVTYSTLMKLIVRKPKPNLTGAVMVLEELKRRGQVSWHAYAFALEAYARMGKADEAESLLDEMVKLGLKPSGDDYFLVLRAFYNSKRAKDCERVMWKAITAITPPMAKWYWKTSAAYVRKGEMASAVRILESMRQGGLHLGIAAYNIILSGFNPDECSAALKLFRHIQESAVEPDIVTYNTILRMVARLSRTDPRRIGGVLQALNRSGLAKDRMTYSALIEVYGKSQRPGDLATAERLLDEYEKSVGKALGCSPYEALLRVYGASAELEGVHRMEGLLKRMEQLNVPIREHAYHLFLRAYQKHPQDKSQKIKQLLLEMERRGCQADAVSYELAFRVFAEDMNSDLEDVKKVYEMIRGTDLIRPNVYRNYLRLLSSRVDVEGVEACIADMQQAGMPIGSDVVACFVEAFEMTRQRDRTAVEEVFEKFIEAGGSPDVRLYNVRLKAAAQGGEFSHASAVLADMHKCGIAPDQETYGALAHAACMSGAFDEGRQWLEQGIRNGFALSAMKSSLQYGHQSFFGLPESQ